MNDYKIIKFRISKNLYDILNDNILYRNKERPPYEWYNVSSYIRKLITEDYYKINCGHDQVVYTNCCSKKVSDE